MMVSVNTLCLMTFCDRKAVYTRIVQKSEPEQELHKLEFLGPSDLFCISKMQEGNDKYMYMYFFMK